MSNLTATAYRTLDEWAAVLGLSAVEVDAAVAGAEARRGVVSAPAGSLRWSVVDQWGYVRPSAARRLGWA